MTSIDGSRADSNDAAKFEYLRARWQHQQVIRTATDLPEGGATVRRDAHPCRRKGWRWVDDRPQGRRWAVARTNRTADPSLLD